MLKKAMAMGFAVLIGLGGAAKAQDNHIDTIRSDAPELAQYGKWSAEANGSFKSDHNYWKGFPNRSAVGLRLEQRKP